jgi:hypothetical protein
MMEDGGVFGGAVEANRIGGGAAVDAVLPRSLEVMTGG